MYETRRVARERASRTSQRKARGLDRSSARASQQGFFDFDQADLQKLGAARVSQVELNRQYKALDALGLHNLFFLWGEESKVEHCVSTGGTYHIILKDEKRFPSGFLLRLGLQAKTIPTQQQRRRRKEWIDFLNDKDFLHENIVHSQRPTYVTYGQVDLFEASISQLPKASKIRTYLEDQVQWFKDVQGEEYRGKQWFPKAVVYMEYIEKAQMSLQDYIDQLHPLHVQGHGVALRQAIRSLYQKYSFYSQVVCNHILSSETQSPKGKSTKWWTSYTFDLKFANCLVFKKPAHPIEIKIADIDAEEDTLWSPQNDPFGIQHHLGSVPFPQLPGTLAMASFLLCVVNSLPKTQLNENEEEQKLHAEHRKADNSKLTKHEELACKTKIIMEVVHDLLRGEKELLVRVCALFCKSTEFFNQSASQLEWYLLGLDDDHGKWDRTTGNLIYQKHAWEKAVTTTEQQAAAKVDVARKRVRRAAAKTTGPGSSSAGMTDEQKEIRERYRWLVLLLLTAMRCRSCLKPKPWALEIFWEPLAKELGISLKDIQKIELQVNFFQLPRAAGTKEPEIKLKATDTSLQRKPRN